MLIRLALDAEVAREADGLGDDVHRRLRDVDVEVHNQMPVCGDIEGGDEGQGAVTDVFELASLRPPSAHRQCRGSPLGGLHPGHFVNAARLDLRGSTLGRQAVGLADIAAFVLEMRIVRAVDPAQPRVRCGFRSTSRRKRPIQRAEISATMPRAIASARAAWVQCVMGKPASLGFSQVGAMIAQICSSVNVAGVPTRQISQSLQERPAHGGR